MKYLKPIINIKLAALPLIFLFAVGVQAENWEDVYKLYPQCDGIDRQGVVHAEKKNGKINGFSEKICVKKENIKTKEENIKQLKEEIIEQLQQKDK